jgi:hypothetical protein
MNSALLSVKWWYTAPRVAPAAEDVDAVHAEFGQRHFIIAAPDGVLVDVITPIEPGPEFAEQFAATSDKSAR